MTSKKRNRNLGIDAKTFNADRHKQFDNTVSVIAKKIVKRINQELEVFCVASYTDVDSVVNLDVCEVVPEEVEYSGILEYRFIIGFDFKKEKDEGRCILFNAIWNRVFSEFVGWNISYKYQGPNRKSNLILKSGFKPQQIIEARSFGDIWQAERDRMVQFFINVSSKCISDACGTVSFRSANNSVKGIVYNSSKLRVSPFEGGKAFEELRDVMNARGWHVQLECEKESLNNIIYPNQLYSIYIQPS